MKKTCTLRVLMGRYPLLEEFCQSKINKEIFRYFRLFTKDCDLMAAAMLQNPSGKTKNLKEIEKNFGAKITEYIKCLNRLHGKDPVFLRQFPRHKEVIILYLINFNYILSDRKNNRPDISKIRYAMKMLRKIDITEIRTTLEDKFFSYIEPEIYSGYHSLLKFTHKKYIKRQKEIRRDFEQLLKQNVIPAKIEMRMKTIYSLHSKIVKKDLLFSQVLDTIGLRIIVDQEEDCYRSMVLILKNAAVMTHRIKDYIASPKENGYQSIHLTIMYGNYPVEIQIRTREMHKRAQFGTASHMRYKSEE